MLMHFRDNLFYLLHQPILPAPPNLDITTEVQVAYIFSSDNSESNNTISSLLCKELDDNSESNSLAKEESKDHYNTEYLSEDVLPAVAAKVLA